MLHRLLCTATLAGLLGAAPLALALPPDLDPTLNPHLGLREDAVGAHAKDDAATADLIEVMKTDPAPDVRARAAKALFDRWATGVGDPNTHKAAAIWAASQGDPGTRASAVRALGDTGDDYTLVVGYLDDDDKQVSAAAYAACERWAERHPDRAGEINAVLSGRELSTEGKARRLIEKIRDKIP
ncbi:MAG: HEAT repeat domain-containing protein [Myxococcota bacterium]